MDILERIRADFGTASLARLTEVGNEAGVSMWTLLRAARGYSANPRYRFLQAMTSWYARNERKGRRRAA